MRWRGWRESSEKRGVGQRLENERERTENERKEGRIKRKDYNKKKRRRRRRRTERVSTSCCTTLTWQIKCPAETFIKVTAASVCECVLSLQQGAR